MPRQADPSGRSGGDAASRFLRRHALVQDQPVRDRHARAGFTLIEVLAAFAVLALLTVAIQEGVVASASSLSKAQTRFAAELVASTLVSGPVPAEQGASGTRSGRLDGFDWTMRIEPLSLERLAEPQGEEVAAAWVPVRLTVEIRRAGGDQPLTTVETVRLVEAAP